MKKLSVLRRVLCTFLAAAMMISAVGCGQSNKSEGNDISINSARKITNYFKSTDFSKPDEISDISSMVCMNNKMYLAGYASASDAEHKATVYDTATGEKADIDVSGINIAYFQNISLSQDTVYIEYSDSSENNTTHICAINRSTGEIIGDAEVGSDTYTTGIYINQSGELCTIATSYKANSQESVMIMYDKTTMQEKQRININEKLGAPENEMIMLVLPQNDGSYYAFAQDMNSREDDSIIIYKLSSSFESVYRKEDAFDDMTGYFNGAYISKNGNLCIMTYDYESDSPLFYVNELDAATGDVADRNEIELQDADILPFVTIEGYDFLYRKDGKLFGYDVENSTEKQIVDYAKDIGEEFEDCYSVSACGSSILLATEVYENGGSESLFEMDADGNILNRIPLPENAQSYNMKVSSDGLINLLSCDYSQSDGSQSYEIVSVDNQGNEKSRTPLKVESGDGNDCYMSDFLISSSGDICGSFQMYSKEGGNGGTDKNIIVVFDSDGNEKFRIEDDTIGYVQGMISASSGDYVYYYNNKSGYELSKIDYENKSMGEKIDIGVNFQRMFPGDGKYDFFYNDGEGIYGYTIKDKKTTEIVNWIDSDIDAQIDEACVVNADKIVIRTYGKNTGEPSVCQLDRVDDETLKLIQNKQIITLAGVGITYGETRDAVVSFNKESDKYRIQVNDYDKYSSYEDDTYLSGAKRLNTDLASGKLPDIIVGNYELDMSSYISKGLLTDLNQYIDKDKDISRDNYFENIFDMYSTDGKLYQLVTDFNVLTLVGKQKDLGDKSGWKFDEFFNFVDGKKAFYMTGREELLDSFVLNNLSEYVDFSKKTCDFNNDNFIKLLDFIKENGMTKEEMDKEQVYGDDYSEDKYNEYLSRFENQKCCLEFNRIGSFSDIAHLQQTVLNDAVSFRGVPSESEGNGAVICADSSIGISEKSKVKDGAWDFVRGFILEDYQKGLNEEYARTLPIMKSAFEDLAKKSQSEDQENGGMNYKDGTSKPLDTKAIDSFRSLVENASRASVSDSRINKIINEQVEIFYKDGQSSKETAEAIQSKASLYLKEIK